MNWNNKNQNPAHVSLLIALSFTLCAAWMIAAFHRPAERSAADSAAVPEVSSSAPAEPQVPTSAEAVTEQEISAPEDAADHAQRVRQNKIQKKVDSGKLAEYALLYPEMYVEPQKKTDDNTKKVVYLTFDDGPSDSTASILDELKAAGIHATFFVTRQGYKQKTRYHLFQRIVDEGHTIAIHTASHDYKKIYKSVSAFLKDFHTMYEEIYDATGIYPTLCRFPGGSVNSYNQKTYQAITAELSRRGFTWHDWNVDSTDASGKNVAVNTLVRTVTSECLDHKKNVVLLHDGAYKTTTAQALPKIIKKLKQKGYSFAALDGTIRPFDYSGQQS